MKNNVQRVLEIFRGMDGFVFIIEKRKEISPRNWKSDKVATINLNNELDLNDIHYIINKSSKHKYFEYRIAKFYKRDEVILDNQSFFSESVKMIDQLKEFYEFVS